jgi:tetratricopeptide (TPR) repeat protein
MRTAIALLLTMVCGWMLVPVRMLLFGAVSSLGPFQTWAISDFSYQLLAFVACGGLLASLLAGAHFFLGPIASTSGEELPTNRLTDLWNLVVNKTFASLMLGQDMKLAKLNAVSGKRSLARFASNYLASRNWMLGMASVPAVVLMLGLSSGDMVRFPVDSLSSQLSLTYLKRLDVAFEKQDFQVASLLVERLSQVDPKLIDPTFALADAMASANQVADAKALMERLISQDRDASRAHFWIAKQCLMQDASGVKSVEEARQHLIAAIRADRSNWEAVYAYSLVLMSQGQYEAAATELRRNTFADPIAELEVARLQQRLGLTIDAAMRGKRLAQRLTSPPEGASSIDSVAYLRAAEAQAISGDLPGALATLESARFDGSPDPRVTDSIVRTLLVLCQLDDPKHQSQRQEYLSRAIDIDPQHPEVSIYCAKLLFSQEAIGEERGHVMGLCRQLVRDAATRSDAPAELFLVLGTGEASKGNFENAKEYLRAALERGEKSASLLNNYAWVIAQTVDGDREYALQLVDEAITIDTSFIDAFSTRAELLVSLERYPEAIIDLERIAAIAGQSRELAMQLADLYDRIGDTKTADTYRKVK